MILRHVVGEWKLHLPYIALILSLSCDIGSAIFDDSHCNYVYRHGCSSSRDVFAGKKTKEAKSLRSCSVNEIEDDIKFTVQLPKDRPNYLGIVKVNFSLPEARCNYKVVLLVNSSITDDEGCANHAFHRSNSYEEEIHSAERTICVLPSFDLTGENTCEGKFSMWYEHVFTGCYALLFTVDEYEFRVLGKKFIRTNYTRTEIMEPKFRCYYEDLIDHEKNKQELVRFALGISVRAGTAGMILSLTPVSSPDETEENACIRYSKQPLYTREINMEDPTLPATKSCSLTTVQLDNETYTRDVECNFELRAQGNVSYCLKITLEDERCNRQTLWKPPPDGKGGKPACAWLQTCTKIWKNTSVIEYSGISIGSEETNSLESDGFAHWPVAIAVLIIVFVISATILFVCRAYSKRTRQIYAKKNSRNLRISKFSTETDSVETTDDEMVPKSCVDDNSNENGKSEPIILLYARGTNAFMNLMTEFRDILRNDCGYRVRDWYDASEWDVVARIGPSAWVADLLRNEHRAIWIDTPRARDILHPEWRKHHFGHCAEDEAASDFRDAALPNVLDSAKRNIAPVGYNKHFVARLEGFDPRDEMDPFEILSPHTRYLIPHHLGELCSHLSSRPASINLQRSLKLEEALLRERLVEMRKES